MSTLNDRIVASAKGWIGTPYHHQASLRGVGCDCIGLVRGVWRELYGAEPLIMPPYTRDWAEALRRETLLDPMREHFHEVPTQDTDRGDVLVFRIREGAAAKHCAILTGSGYMVHAQENTAVMEITLTPWWRRRLVAAFRFPSAI